MAGKVQVTANPLKAQITPIVNGGAKVNVQFGPFVVSGAGFLLASNNLSDVANAETAFGNIKQAATTGITGVVKLAASGDASAGLAVQGNDSRLIPGSLMPTTIPAAGRILVGNAGGTAYGLVPVSGDASLASTGALTLANTAVTPGVYSYPTLTVDSKGRITAAASGSVTGGTVTSVSVVTANGISGSVANPTTTPAITLVLGAITPSSVAAIGTVTGSNLSGTNTGDQTNITGNAGTATKLQTGRTIAITGDLAWTSPAFDGSGNVTAAGALATVNSNVGTFGSATQVAQATVNGKGLVTAMANVTVTPAVGSITGLGTGVATALGVNIGSAGAPVLFNGAGGTPSSLALANATGLLVAGGGTGAASFTAYAVLCGGTTSTGALQSITSVGTAGQVLTSNGAGALPTFQAVTGTGNVTAAATLTSNQLVLGAGTTAVATLGSLGTTTTLLHGNATGAPTFAAVSLTADVTGTLPVANGGTGITSFGSGVATWLGTPSSANLAAAITDETGSGALVFGTAPTFPTKITIGAASGTTGSIDFKGTTSGTVTVKPSDAAGTWTLTLPTSSGTNGYVLSTNGSGVTSWIAAGSGSGDMLKSVYDPQNVGYISGAIGGGGGVGGFLVMDGSGVYSGGLINTSGGASGNGGQIVTTGGAANGGSIFTYSGGTAAGGNIDTSDGGGSIVTTGTGSIQLGVTGTRTTIVGAASSDWTLTLPVDAGTNGYLLKTNGSGVTSWVAAGSGSGDMLKSVYDPQNLGYISGAVAAGGNGGWLNMDGGVGGTGGDIFAVGGSGASADAGSISLDGGSGDNATGGTLNMFGGASNNASGGAIATYGVTLPGGSILTYNGGGSIDTTGTGSIEMGVSGTRTTITGTASTNRAIAFPDAAGTVALTTSNVATATALATPRAIYGNNFDGTADLTQVIASTYGGTGNGFTKFTGPTTSEKTFALPNADATLLYSGGDAGTPSAIVLTNASGTAASLTAGAITLPASLGSSTATTQSPGDISTKLATTAFVANAVLGQNFKEAAKYATTAALPTVVYSNGSSGVGATITAVGFGALSLDGNTPSVADRVLVKNQVSTFQNGIYVVTAVGSVAAVFVMTRATDADQSTDWETGDSIFVTGGSTQATTTWAYTGVDAPTIGTDVITFAQTAGQGSFTAGNGISITGVSIAIDTSVTVDKTTAQTLTNKTLTSPTLTTPVLGTPSSGNLANCTFPTLNQNTSGSAASLSISGQTGLMTVTGLASTNRIKTVRDAADTILELGGSYTPSGTWTSMTLVTPALGTPVSGVLTNCTGLPPAGQTTAGRTLSFGFGKDGGGSALSTATIASAWTAPYDCTITGYSLSADTGTFTVKFWKIASGTAIPTIANVINTSGLSLSSGTHVRSSTTSDFTTTSITAGDIVMCAITAVSSATWITAQVEYTKN